jgi:pantoate--beta-alanine ligase
VEVVSRILRMRAVVEELRRQRRRVALVPTMGALHAGHLSLVRLARERGADPIVSIFVNPRQFGPSEDFASYPRDLTRDCELLVREGVSHVFAPEAEEIYPEGFCTHVEVEGLSDLLIGASRPGHFRGVTTVVLKLFSIVQPDLAVFGMKDAQQLVVLQRMVRDLSLPVELLPAPTVRESDGLAASSRNQRLDDDGRRAARQIYRSLLEAMRIVQAGERSPQAVEEAVIRVLSQEPRLEIDHVKVVDAADLVEPRRLGGLHLVLVAVRVRMEGRPPVLLTDNVRIEVEETKA